MTTASARTGLVLSSTTNSVTTLTMNMPARLNGWTMEMMEALKGAMDRAADDPATKVVILTGTDPYYSAGVNLGSALQLAHPRTLHAQIVAHNEALFEGFIAFPKPILAAVNGPAIGATVTTAALCDGIIASERATFSTPFARLGLPPEGCSSVHFPRLLGEANAARMLGEEGYKPTGEEAHAIGLAGWVVPHEQLLAEAQRIGETWVAEGRARTFPAGASIDELRAVNATESVAVADAFLGARFLRAQHRFLRSRKKWGPAATFLGLWLTRPVWSRLL
ncbi:MAG: peroxisomal 3,2-trans-enoyl-CoA isomerase [Myxococcota bacterium]|jgi:peroxisomal 3,2-trans-enoyl-CoA isomerase